MQTSSVRGERLFHHRVLRSPLTLTSPSRGEELNEVESPRLELIRENLGRTAVLRDYDPRRGFVQNALSPFGATRERSAFSSYGRCNQHVGRKGRGLAHRR